MLESVPASH